MAANITCILGISAAVCVGRNETDSTVPQCSHCKSYKLSMSMAVRGSMQCKTSVRNAQLVQFCTQQWFARSSRRAQASNCPLIWHLWRSCTQIYYGHLIRQPGWLHERWLEAFYLSLFPAYINKLDRSALIIKVAVTAKAAVYNRSATFHRYQPVSRHIAPTKTSMLKHSFSKLERDHAFFRFHPSQFEQDWAVIAACL